MTIKYRAAFADGEVVTRTTSSDRAYTHCWRYGQSTGFSGSLQLAQDALRQRQGWSDQGGRPRAYSEIVPVFVLSQHKPKPRISTLERDLARCQRNANIEGADKAFWLEQAVAAQAKLDAARKA